MPSYRPGKGAKQAELDHGITGAIKLASNEHAEPTIDPIVAAITEAAQHAHLYADHRATAVRERLADHLGVDAARITASNGSVVLLQQICLTYVDPGDEVVYPWRSFEVYPVFTKLLAGSPVEVALAADLGVDIDALVEAVSDRTKIVFVATPNNPTGVAATTADLRHLLEAVPTSTIVVVDEAYREFLDPGFGDPVAELVPEFDHLVVTRTFSKAHGLAGARFGYGIGHPEVIADIDKTLAPFAVSALAQAAALAAIDHLDLIDEAAQRILAERARVEVELAGRGWQLPNHQGNFIWLSLGERTDAVALELERRGVVVRPFSGEGIRVTIGSPIDNDRFLAALHEVAAP